MKHVRIEMGEVVNGDVSPDRVHVEDLQFLNDDVIAALFGHWIEYEDGSLRYRYQQDRRELVATFIEAKVEDFCVQDPDDRKHKAAAFTTSLKPSSGVETKTLTLTPTNGEGLRLGYVVDGKLITSTYVPLSGQGVMKDLAAHLPQFASYLDVKEPTT